MAAPLSFDPKTLLPTDEERLLEGTTAQVDSILEALELLGHLHEHKVLHTLIRVVQGGQGLASTALEALNEPGAVRAIRNLLELVRVLGSIEPEGLRDLSGALGDGLKAGAERLRNKKQVGVGELLSLARDPDVSLALGAALETLRGFGRGLRSRAEVGETPQPTHT